MQVYKNVFVIQPNIKTPAATTTTINYKSALNTAIIIINTKNSS